MKKLQCYYAHTMTSYNSTIEAQDIELLKSLGFEVINPNQEKYRNGCKQFTVRYGWEKVMDYFTQIVSECDIVAFRALPNGQILSGIAAEVTYALDNNIPIIELPCSLRKRMMEYPETKQYLIELGHYKL